MPTGLRIYSLGMAAGEAGEADGAIAAFAADLGFNALHVPTADERSRAAAAEAGLDLFVDLPAHADPAPILAAGLERGARGFVCRQAGDVPVERWHDLIAEARRSAPGTRFCAETLARPPAETLALAPARFDYLFSSVGWWNLRDSWWFQQDHEFSRVAASLGMPRGEGADLEKERCRRLIVAAGLTAGLFVTREFLQGPGFGPRLAVTTRALNRLKREHEIFDLPAEVRDVDSGSEAAVWIRTRPQCADAALLVVNRGNYAARVDLAPAADALPRDWERLIDVTPGEDPIDPILPRPLLPEGEFRVLLARRPPRRAEPDLPVPPTGHAPSRVIIESVGPEIDGGRFPVKRIAGDSLQVSADIYRDGHDRLAAAVRVRQAGETHWMAEPLADGGNDRWSGRFPLARLGRGEYEIEAWTDHFASWREEVGKKRAAGQKVGLELKEGRSLLAAAASRSRGVAGSPVPAYLAAYDALPAGDEEARAEFLLSPLVEHAERPFADRSDRAVSGRHPFMVDRTAARFSAWYEMFPRSQGSVEGQSASFADCAGRLPEIRALGFDVVYLVPIHPIGQVNRKGRNNSPVAEPGEPGSPYAIGSAAGGHTAIEPSLGTLEEFRDFLKQVREHGMEVALDFAVQCAPDHPWLEEHPGWFRRRPDGTVRYAENPPKKYQDIVNVDFDQADWRGLWEALRDAVRFWMNEGVRIFRVDNPHTKPVAFWEWLIADLQRTDPDVLFLAEAFTRPKMMRRLAKAGFSQSYTYFTWRNTKAELTEYLTELTRTDAAEYFRPNFFANTPDILPSYLQTSGRPGFRIRLTLAATLSACYGIYNGFELCEAAALPGREEYDDSEKYAYKVWDWDRTGHIKDDVARLNRLRWRSPALQRNDGLEFHASSHPSVLFYSKTSADGADRVFVAVTLDPFQPVRTDLLFPLAALGLGPEATFITDELFSGWRQQWAGASHTIDLNPAVQPALVWRLQ